MTGKKTLAELLTPDPEAPAPEGSGKRAASPLTSGGVGTRGQAPISTPKALTTAGKAQASVTAKLGAVGLLGAAPADGLDLQSTAATGYRGTTDMVDPASAAPETGSKDGDVGTPDE